MPKGNRVPGQIPQLTGAIINFRSGGAPRTIPTAKRRQSSTAAISLAGHTGHDWKARGTGGGLKQAPRHTWRCSSRSQHPVGKRPGSIARMTPGSRIGTRPRRGRRSCYLAKITGASTSFVDAGGRQQPVQAAFVDPQSRLRWQVMAAPADAVVLQGAAHPVIGHGAMLQTDAAACAEARGEERTKLGGAARSHAYPALACRPPSLIPRQHPHPRAEPAKAPHRQRRARRTRSGQ